MFSYRQKRNAEHNAERNAERKGQERKGASPLVAHIELVSAENGRAILRVVSAGNTRPELIELDERYSVLTLADKRHL